MKNRHPYELRKRLRSILPWFLIDLGVAVKGKDCQSVNANHSLYNIDGVVNGCYYCEQEFPRDPKLTKTDAQQEILVFIGKYLKGEKTAKEIYNQLCKEQKCKSQYSYQFISNLSNSIGVNVFDSIEFEDYFEGATRPGIIKLIENYQKGELSEIEIENWSDSLESWKIVENENKDELVQNLINEFGFGELHLKELFTNKVLNQLKEMLNRKESAVIEDFKLTTVFTHHKRRLANALKELKSKNDSRQLESYLEERTELNMQDKIIQELKNKASKEIDENIKIVEKLISEYVNGKWKASS
jgi:hypothetical protein